MVQNITYSPAEGAECLWLCLMTTIFLLVSFDCFPLFCMLSLLWLNLLFDKSQAEDMGGIKDHRILLHFINTLFTAAKSWVAPVSIIRKKKRTKETERKCSDGLEDFSELLVFENYEWRVFLGGWVNYLPAYFLPSPSLYWIWKERSCSWFWK